jgi:hypothetical protein
MSSICWLLSIPCSWWLASSKLKTQNLNSIRLASVEFILATLTLILPSIASTPDMFLPFTIAVLAVLGFELNVMLSSHLNHHGLEVWNRDVDSLSLMFMLGIKLTLGLASNLLGLGLVPTDGFLGSLLLALAAFSLYLGPLASTLSSRSSTNTASDISSPPHPPLERERDTETLEMLTSRIRKSEDLRRASGEEVMKSVRGLFSTVSSSIVPDTFNSIPLLQLRELAESRMKDDIELDIEHMSFLQLVKLSRGEPVPPGAIKAKTPAPSRASSLPIHNFITPENIGVKASKPAPLPAAKPSASVLSAPLDDGPWKEVVELLWAHSSEVAHDMKNPLSGVLALSQNVIAGVFGELPKGAQDQMHVVRACAYHLLNMINMLRDMMKMLASGQADMSINKVGLDGPVEEIMSRMSPMVGNRMTIHWDKTPPEELAIRSVLADDQRLYQVLHCVIANVSSFSPHRSCILIECFFQFVCRRSSTHEKVLFTWSPSFSLTSATLLSGSLTQARASIRSSWTSSTRSRLPILPRRMSRSRLG